MESKKVTAVARSWRSFSFASCPSAFALADANDRGSIHPLTDFRAKSEAIAEDYRRQKNRLIIVLRRLMKALAVRMRTNWTMFEALSRYYMSCSLVPY